MNTCWQNIPKLERFLANLMAGCNLYVLIRNKRKFIINIILLTSIAQPSYVSQHSIQQLSRNYKHVPWPCFIHYKANKKIKLHNKDHSSHFRIWFEIFAEFKTPQKKKFSQAFFLLLKKNMVHRNYQFDKGILFIYLLDGS